MTVDEIQCPTWEALREAVMAKEQTSNILWFRGCGTTKHRLLPSLMRDTTGLTQKDHDQFEQDVFFEFQARATELRRHNLTDWEYLFFGRHYGMPNRVLDWTDTLGVALYFALEGYMEKDRPCLWIIDPIALNYETWGVKDIVLPRYLGNIKGEYWDFSELLAGEGDWAWDGPVAIYPIQINDRVRAQRGWFTIHGNNRDALDSQFPHICTRLVLGKDCINDAQNFLSMAGLNRFSIYPDLENLTRWIREERLAWAGKRRKSRLAGKAQV